VDVSAGELRFDPGRSKCFLLEHVGAIIVAVDWEPVLTAEVSRPARYDEGEAHHVPASVPPRDTLGLGGQRRPRAVKVPATSSSLEVSTGGDAKRLGRRERT